MSSEKSPVMFLEEDRGHETPCWIWQRSIRESGYGRLGNDNAHRAMYQRLVGEVPSDMHVDHKCKVRACVNPDHMEVVTQQVNIQRGRLAKLCEEDVRKIKAMRGSMSQKKIGEIFGVGQDEISRILSGKRWSNVYE